MGDTSFHTITALRLIGFIYLVMPITVWLALRGRHNPASLHAWCGGAAIYGVAYMLYGWRGVLPDWLTVYVAGALAFASYGLRLNSLRIEADQAPRWGLAVVWTLIAWGWFLAADAHSEPLRFAAGNSVHMVGAAALAWQADRVWRVAGLRNARTISLVYAAFSVSWALLVAQIGMGGWKAAVQTPNLMTVVAVIVGVVAGMYGSLGFMGLSIERSHARDLQRAQDLARESTQRLAAEEQAGRLRGWLDEREEMLRLLAHEVRQPLNNATAALQAARRAMTPAGLDAAAAAQRLLRAEAVLGQIIGTLDNTLAATALLASPDRVERRDVDVDTVLALATGDLDADQRRRVRVEKVASTRTATMDAGLMRLALRNLLSNALAYSRAELPVLLRVTDSDEPLALLFEVIDQGPGIDAALAPRLFERGVRGTDAAPGHGLGLYVVRRVMELHGGSVDLRANAPAGAIFRLTLPQDLADTLPPRRAGATVAAQAVFNSPRKR